MTASLLAAICKIGMLASVLFTYHEFACPGDWLTLTCPQHSVIRIRWAEFGYLTTSTINCLGDFVSNETKSRNCLAENSLQVVTDECGGRQTCRLRAVQKSFSSPSTASSVSAGGRARVPSSGVEKVCAYNQLEVGYQCLPIMAINETICYGETMKITCPLNLVIAFSSTVFGYLREDENRCTVRPAYHADCFEPCAISVIATRCQGRRSCHVSVTRETLGDACRSHTNPYLQISYSCVYRRTLKEGIDWTSMFGCDKSSLSTPPTLPFTFPPRKEDFKEKHHYRSGSILTSLLSMFVFLSANVEKLVLYASIGFLVGLIAVLITIIVKLTVYICNKRNRKYCTYSCLGKPRATDGNHAPNENESESTQTMPRQVSAEVTLGDNGGCSPIFVHMESPRESPLLGRVAPRKKRPPKKSRKWKTNGLERINFEAVVESPRPGYSSKQNGGKINGKSADGRENRRSGKPPKSLSSSNQSRKNPVSVYDDTDVFYVDGADSAATIAREQIGPEVGTGMLGGEDGVEKNEEEEEEEVFTNLTFSNPYRRDGRVERRAMI